FCVLVLHAGPAPGPKRPESVFRAFAWGRGVGTGLGLTISRDIVRAHGGDMELDVSPAGGLRVKLILP
ncbi:MAG: ATP-binding protein, partial [Acetobacter malorum]